MSTNILRIAVEKILFRMMNKKMQQSVETYKEKPVETVKKPRNYTDVAALRERLEKMEMFKIYPNQQEMYVPMLQVFYPVFKWLAIIVTIAVVAILGWDSITGASENAGGNKVEDIIVIIVCVLGLFALAGMMKYVLNYMENTVTIFYESKICIRRYRREDVEINYKELRDSILKKGIKVRNGRLELPYSRGKILVYSYGESAMWGGFYRYINRKCELNIPEISKKDCEVIRKAGMGSVIGSMLGIPFVIFGVFMGIVCMLGDCGFDYTIQENIEYLVRFLLEFNLSEMLGAFFIIIGLILNLIHIWPVKKLFKDSKDIIKVKLF